MTALKHRAPISPDDYLVMEAVSPVKHEYFDGKIFQMAGASLAHNLITMNIAGTLFGMFSSGDCFVVQNDMRLYIEQSNLFTYPDVMVVCGKPALKRKMGLDNLLNPILIVEVLSPTTEDYDKTEKFDHYRTIPSLKEYVLVWQNKKRVARYTRREDDSWLLTDFIGDVANIELASVNCSLSLDGIYNRVEMPE